MYRCAPGAIDRPIAGVVHRAGKVADLSTGQSNQRKNQGNGLFFTIDSNDLNHNVDAFIIRTNFPSPYPDYDDDNGNGKREQAEMLSTSVNFPAAETTYEVGVWWSHSYYSGGQWRYDPDGGSIEFVENLSDKCAFFCGDTYNTHCCNANLFLNKTYPANAKNAVASAGGVEGAEQQTASSGEPIAVPERRSYFASVQDGGSDVHLHPDVSGGLEQYARAARGLAKATIQKGPARGVLTFARPITWPELEELRELGIVVESIEVATTQASDGLRWSYFAAPKPENEQLIGEATTEDGVTPLGIVSATVKVPTAAALNATQNHPAVFLVDLSISDFTRHNSGVVDVSLNDLFWELSDWD